MHDAHPPVHISAGPPTVHPDWGIRVLSVNQTLRAARRAWYMPLLPIYFLARRGLPVERDVVQAFVASGGSTREHPGAIDVLEMLSRREYRSVRYTRLRSGNARLAAIAALLRHIYPGQIALEISSARIGPGLSVVHGFATIVVARRIGCDCMIAQQVTIGFKDPERPPPIIGDRVSVQAGAIVLGEIEVGHDAVIGAGAVVLSDVPAYAVMVGVPARVLRYNDPRDPESASRQSETAS